MTLISESTPAPSKSSPGSSKLGRAPWPYRLRPLGLVGETSMFLPEFELELCQSHRPVPEATLH